MSIHSLSIYSKHIAADRIFYQHLCGCRDCQIIDSKEETVFDNENIKLHLKDSKSRPECTGHYTGACFISADLEYDREFLHRLGSKTTEIDLSSCGKYLVFDCKDFSGNTVTLMQVNEAAASNLQAPVYLR